VDVGAEFRDHDCDTVSSDGVVFVTGGYPPVRPIYAIRAGGTGDISLPHGAASSAAIAWSNSTEGTYIPTPIVYRNRLITLNVNGIVTAYDIRSGAHAFRGRVGAGGAFSASPIAADGPTSPARMARLLSSRPMPTSRWWPRTR
jgi:hypothetical protein